MDIQEEAGRNNSFSFGECHYSILESTEEEEDKSSCYSIYMYILATDSAMK
jgi:hypothetical protein